MTKRKYKYMHTIKGKPADFSGGDQITYGGQYVELYDDLKKIRNQEVKSNEWRKKRGYSDSSYEYGYKKIIMGRN